MLLAAVPDLAMTGAARTAVAGEVPNPLDPPRGVRVSSALPLRERALPRAKRPTLQPARGRRRGRLPRGRGGSARGCDSRLCIAVGVARSDGTRAIGYNSCLRVERRGAPVAGRPALQPPHPSAGPHCASPRSSSPGSSRSSTRRRSPRPASSSASSAPTAAASPTSSTPCAGCSANRRPRRCAASRCRTSSSTAPASASRSAARRSSSSSTTAPGRIGGQWGQYAELSIKRVLTRDERFVVLHQQHPGAPPRHPRSLPRHRPRPARLRDHRAGDDLARDRGEARGAARLPRGGRRRLEVQGAAQGNRRPARRHAQEPRARRGHPDRARQPAREARRAGEGRHRVSASTRRA